MDRQNYLQIN